MNKKFAWELFTNTGNIDAYMLMKDVEFSEQLIRTENNASEVIGDCNGNNKNQGNSYEDC